MKCIITGMFLFSICLPLPMAWANEATDIVKASGIKGGLVVYVGKGDDSDSVGSLRVNDSYLVHGLIDVGSRSKRSVAVEKLRERIRAKGLYGPVSVDVWDGEHLPYADNLVNLLIVNDAKLVSGDEMMRALAPRGIAMVKKGDKWETITKPRPKEMDEWPQWLHGPDNVLVSKDTLVGPPRRMQWMGNPPWARMHNDIEVPASVNLILSANGRVFYDMDNGFPDSDKMPARFFLVARDAFNGVLLWKRPMADWYKNVEYRRGNPPIVIQRRVVCDGDRLYMTMSNDGPVVVLDAATGKTLRTFEKTEGAHELVLAGGKLFVVIWEYDKPYPHGYHMRGKGSYASSWRSGDPPKSVSGARSLVIPMFQEKVRTRLLVIDVRNGKTLWQRKDDEMSQILPQTLAVDAGCVFLKTPEQLHCIKADTGKAVWTENIGVPLQKTEKIGKWFLVTKANNWYWNIHNTSRVMVLKDIVLTVAQDKLYAVAKKDGKQLWTGPALPGFVSPPEIFPIGDTVYVGHKSRSDGYQPIDLKTGKPKPHIPLSRGGMVHHRCYRRLSTSKYLLSSMAGIEFHDLATGSTSENQWTRANCLAGFLPANGLIYLTPHPCACFTGTKMNGMLAYAPRGESKGQVPKSKGKLEKGLAFSSTPRSPVKNNESADWPMYRRDPARGGSTPAVVSPTLKSAWSVKLGTKLSPISVAGGRVFVAAVDEHTVHCLNAVTGKLLWSYTAGGRVDTPPTICNGLAAFGCKDGWTYCLQADDGKLVWRFRGGPEKRLVGVFDQLESAWPVHGSVIVLTKPEINKGRPVVYLSAGRNTFLDSGIYVYGLDLETGKVVADHVLSGPYGETGNPIVQGRWVIKGVKADFLVFDGEYLYMKDTVLNLDCSQASDAGNDHLIATGRSLLDGYWHHRSLWVLDTTTPYSTKKKTAGNFLVFHGPHAYAFRSHGGGRNSTFDPASGYQLIRYTTTAADPGKAAKAQPEPKKKRTPPAPRAVCRTVWSNTIDLVCKAMILTGGGNSDGSKEILFVAGMRNFKDPFAVEQALQGQKGGLLYAISASDGKKIVEYKLESPPVYDGMAACAEKLYIALQDGRVICMDAR